ncbi:MAG TPA: hypothetical protein VK453_16715 [Micromonosporaceae bacterium]|nr:hypothetical protein [Micromonosporaceae bacterium]
MRARRTLALFAAAGAMLAATGTAVFATPGAAAAHRPSPGGTGYPAAYPPPPPVVTVNRGLVAVGSVVRISGAGFAPREALSINVRTRISLRGHGWRGPVAGHGNQWARTTNEGTFRRPVFLPLPGFVTITVHGLRSGVTASTTVRVVLWRRGWPHHWRSTGLAGSAEPTVTTPGLTRAEAAPAMRLAASETATSTDEGSGNGAPLVATLALVGLAGAGLVGLRRQRGDRHGTG